MGIEYTLSLHGDIEVASIIDHLTSSEEYEDHGTFLSKEGIKIFVQDAQGLSAQIIEDEFGFYPKIQITFMLNKFSDLALLQKRVITMVDSLLRKETGDTVLLFNGESVILLRIGSELRLNKNEKFWQDDILSLVNPPYKFETIESI